MSSYSIIGIGDEILILLGTILLGLLIMAIWFSTAVRNENPVVSITLPVQSLARLQNLNIITPPNASVATVTAARASSLRINSNVNPVTTTTPSVSETHNEDPPPLPEITSPQSSLTSPLLSSLNNNHNNESSLASEESISNVVGASEISDNLCDESSSSSPSTKKSVEETKPIQSKNSIKDEDEATTSSSSSSVENSVRIRLKFLNETIKEVRGGLNESVGIFKAKHFAEDIADNKNIRLIFNGHVLNRDSKTLSQCGFFDNCVVHCLIHNRRPVPNSDEANTNGAAAGTNVEGEHLIGDMNEMDLSSICFPLMGSILSVVWWCQLIYGQYFSWSSTWTLISLTGLYFWCLSSFYYN